MSLYLGKVTTAALLVAASVTPKLWIERRSTQVDVDRLDEEIGRRLKAASFRISIDRSPAVPAIRASRPDCRLILWNGDRARELSVIFKRSALDYGPVLIGYRGHWSPDPARGRAVLERFAQDGAARVGIHFGRPAVIALARSGPCRGLPKLLDGLTVHSAVSAESRSPEA